MRLSESLGGLAARSIYQCRLVLSNGAGVAHGALQQFTTGRPVFGSMPTGTGLAPRRAWAGPEAVTVGIA